MSDDLVTIYKAASFGEAEMIHQRLEAEGVDAFVEQTASPLDGLDAMGQGTPIMVKQSDEAAAQEIVAAYLTEHYEEDDA